MLNSVHTPFKINLERIQQCASGLVKLVIDTNPAHAADLVISSLVRPRRVEIVEDEYTCISLSGE